MKLKGDRIKIYIVTSSIGEWEDYRVNNEFCCMNKKKAESEVARLNKELDEYKARCIEEIEDYNENSTLHCSECKTYECDNCEFHIELDYNYNEHHGYHLQEIDLVL